MKRRPMYDVLIVAIAIMLLTQAGCSGCSNASDTTPPQPSIVDGLESSDVKERIDALETAREKYGAES